MKKQERVLLAVSFAGILALSACSSKTAEPEVPPATGIETGAPEIEDPDAGAVVADMVVEAELGAITSGFTPVALTAPADDDLSINFNNNDDGVPHGIQIFSGDGVSGDTIFKADEPITGVASTTYNFGPLEPGTYAFNCIVHPSMVGAITVVAGQ